MTRTFPSNCSRLFVEQWKVTFRVKRSRPSVDKLWLVVLRPWIYDDVRDVYESTRDTVGRSSNPDRVTRTWRRRIEPSWTEVIARLLIGRRWLFLSEYWNSGIFGISGYCSIENLDLKFDGPWNYFETMISK